MEFGDFQNVLILVLTPKDFLTRQNCNILSLDKSRYVKICRLDILVCSHETLSRSVQLTIVSPKRTKIQKTRLPQFARNANVISQGLAWTALERCEDGE